MMRRLLLFAGRLSGFAARVLSRPYYSVLFKEFGRGASVYRPLKVIGGEYIIIGRGAHLHRDGWMAAVRTGETEPVLTIGDGACIGNFYHLVCTGRVHIGRDALLADRVFITDGDHVYDNPSVPVLHQGVRFKSEVRIGDGAWIGEGACIVAANVGRNSVVGANAVVTADIPDNCVAAGNPARIIKRYDPSSGRWARG